MGVLSQGWRDGRSGRKPEALQAGFTPAVTQRRPRGRQSPAVDVGWAGEKLKHGSMQDPRNYHPVFLCDDWT